MPRGDGIKPLGSLFEKYTKTLKAPQGHVVDTFCEVVKDVLGVEINKGQVKYTPVSKTLSLSLPGAIKTEILLNQRELLIHLKARLGTKNTPTELI